MRTHGSGSSCTGSAGQALRLCLALIVMVTALVACSAAPGGAGGSSAAVGDGASAVASPAASAQTAGAGSTRAKAGADWQHALQVVADLRAQPPSRPLVLMIGSSIVRESTTSDASWAAQVQQRGGPLVAAYDLGSSNQSFAQDIKLVGYLPAVPTIVFIGVDVVRFVSLPADPGVTLPAPKPVSSSYSPHRYSSARILPASQKRTLVTNWMTNRFPVFSKNYSYNLGRLRKLIEACLARGLHPVLLDTPRNTAVIGHGFDQPVGRYRASCKQLAAHYSIPFVDMVRAARFNATDFYDLWHAVQPGRAKWQLLLSNQTVKLLQRYGMK
jgi:hypothetical protein